MNDETKVIPLTKRFTLYKIHHIGEGWTYTLNAMQNKKNVMYRSMTYKKLIEELEYVLHKLKTENYRGGFIKGTGFVEDEIQ